VFDYILLKFLEQNSKLSKYNTSGRSFAAAILKYFMALSTRNGPLLLYGARMATESKEMGRVRVHEYRTT
jgi:hypothetical protein